jgi:hypothetical protein
MDKVLVEDVRALHIVQTLHAVLKPEGRVLLRSSKDEPWYITVFRQSGFMVSRLGKTERQGYQ